MNQEHALARALQVCAFLHLVPVPALLVAARRGMWRSELPDRQWAALDRARTTELAILVAGLGLVVAAGVDDMARGARLARALAGVIGLFWTHRCIAVVRLHAALWPSRGAGFLRLWLLGALFALVSVVYWIACWQGGATW